MKSVRLPIFDEHGIETSVYLEIDLLFFISSTRGLRSNLVRINPDPYEKVLEEQRVAKEEALAKLAPPEEWRTIEGIPSKNFEINQKGEVRNRFRKQVIDPHLDLESPYYMNVRLMINSQYWYINGPTLAREMWAPKNYPGIDMTATGDKQ